MHEAMVNSFCQSIVFQQRNDRNLFMHSPLNKYLRMFPAFCCSKQCHLEHIFATLLVHTNRNAFSLYTREELLSQMHCLLPPKEIMSICLTCSHTSHTSPSTLSSSVFSTLFQYISSANLVGMKWYLSF